MANQQTRKVTVDEEEVSYKYEEAPNGYWINAPKLNEFFVMELDRADGIVVNATRIRRKYPSG